MAFHLFRPPSRYVNSESTGERDTTSWLHKKGKDRVKRTYLPQSLENAEHAARSEAINHRRIHRLHTNGVGKCQLRVLVSNSLGSIWHVLGSLHKKEQAAGDVRRDHITTSTYLRELDRDQLAHEVGAGGRAAAGDQAGGVVKRQPSHGRYSHSDAA